jgi:flagellar basal-body rod protein FlgB
MKIFNSSFQALEHALNTATLKQRTISSNIANVDTPHYKSKQVVFQSELKKALEHNPGLKSYRTDSKHIPFSTQVGVSNPSAKVVTRSNTLFNHNGNNVDMDYEMAEMAKNQLWYSALTDRMNGKFSSLKTVINDGR